MGPSLATASGLEGRLRPEFLDCKGGPWWAGAGGSWREPLTTGALLEPRAAPLASLSRGRHSHQSCPGFRRRNKTGPETRRTKGCSVGLGAGPGKWGGCGLGETCAPIPHPLAALKTTPVYLGAGQETYWLPLPPSQTVSRGWGGSGPVAVTPSIISSRWGSTQGGVICLPCHGRVSPAQALGPSAGQGRGPQKGGSQEHPLPSAPIDTPQSESHACPCI